jgi:hypothetical protein
MVKREKKGKEKNETPACFPFSLSLSPNRIGSNPIAQVFFF